MNRLAFLAGLSLLILTGCATGPKTFTKDAPREVPSGWLEHDRPEAGFFMAAPNHYKLRRPGLLGMANLGLSEDEGDPAAAAAAAERAANDPGVVSKDDQASQQERGLLLVLFDNNVRPTVAEAMTQVQVKREGVGAIDLTGAEARMQDKVRKDGSVRRVTLPIGEAVEGKMSFQNQGGDTVMELWYFVPNGGDLWSFKFLSVNQPQAFDQIAEPIMQTVRIKPQS